MDGKADWMAYGLPIEGDDGPFLGERVSPVATCDARLSVGDARRALEESAGDLVVVVAGDGLVVGEIDARTIQSHPDDDPVLAVMDPVPTTVRPSVTVESVADAGGGRRLVTTSDGRLLGEATIEASEHEASDPDPDPDHDHDRVDVELYERELTEVMEDVQKRFGDREPAEAELRAFLRERLVGEGRSPEDADRFLSELED